MLQAKKLGKKFGNEWIFKGLEVDWTVGQQCALIGGNGSGKSTLLKILAGMIPPTTGSLKYQEGTKEIEIDVIFKQLSFCAPYMQLPEEFALGELLHFHSQFKTLQIPLKQLAEEIGFRKYWDKPVKYFSSGMKQKLKLALALYSDVKILFLDEPTSNFDQANIDWYRQTVQEKAADKLLLLASNQEYEYDFCNLRLRLADFKN
jgi:ABC-type multidrug transport system ATPase subunit